MLKGSVIDRNSKELLLFKATEDIRNSGTPIPIVNGKFEYHLSYSYPEAYQLIFKDELDKGAWKPVLFFPDEGEINFTLYPFENFDKNQISGGSLNHIYLGFQQVISSKFIPYAEKIQDKMKLLRQNGEYYSDTASFILEK